MFKGRTPSLPVARRVSSALLLAGFSFGVLAADSWRFEFGAAKPSAGYINVRPDMEYSATRGFGFESGAVVRTVEDASGDRLHAGYLTGDKPFFFSADLPEGNYNVTVTLGAGNAASSTTVKAELRRLMLENVATTPGTSITRTFTVNVRTPRIPASGTLAAGAVELKAPRETVQEAWAWDRRLTLEINGARPAVRAIEITPVQAPTLFLLGDSTVCDQPGEPYNSWGQMLPRFLKPGIAVANHGESGETYRDSLQRRRLDKILSAMRPGDTVLMQFGHNDQKQIKDGKSGAFTTYKEEIRAHVEAIRSRGGVAVIISPMERRQFDAGGKVVPSLADYADAARQSAQELGVPFIDLNAMSKPLYEALGPELSKRAFAEPEPGRVDNTHHSNYGSYQLAQAVLAGLRQSGVTAAAYIADGYGHFDPSRPDPVETFAVPPSPYYSNQRPLGDDAAENRFTRGSSQIGKRFPSERKVVKDPVTGVMLTFLTSKPHGDSKIYPTHPQWTSDGKWVVFRSALARDEAMAVNEQSGDIVQVTEGGYTGMLNLARKSMKLYFMRKDAVPKRLQIVEVDLAALLADSAAGKLKAADAYQRICGTTEAQLEAGGDMALDADEDWVYFRVGPAEAARHLAPGVRIEPAFGPRNMGAGPNGIARMHIRTGEVRHVVSVPFQIGHIQANLWNSGEIVFCWETGGKSPQRTWTVMADGGGLRPLYPEAAHEWVTHEAVISKDEVAMAIMGHRPIVGGSGGVDAPATGVGGANPGQDSGWGPSGTREKPSGLAIVNLRTREMTIAGQTPSGSGLWHVHGSSDGRWAVGDDFSRSVYLIDRRTREMMMLTTGHKTTAADHPHPTFSADGTRIEIQSAMLSEDGRTLNICIVPVPEAWLRRR